MELTSLPHPPVNKIPSIPFADEVSYWIAKETNSQVLGTDLCIPFIEEAQKNLVLPNMHAGL